MGVRARLLVGLVVGFAIGAAPAVGAQAQAGSAAALERGLDAIDVHSIEADVEFLASDELGGRDTPSEGLLIAARFLRARLQRLGLEPGGPDGWFYRYPLFSRRVEADGVRCTLQLGGDEPTPLRFGEDLGIRTLDTRPGSWSGGMVFCGKGRERDLDDCDVQGRWAVCVDSPGSRRRRERALEAAGAIGIVIVPEAEDGGRDQSDEFAEWRDRAGRAKPSAFTERAAAAMEGLPVFYVDREVARRMLEKPSGDRVAVGTQLGATLSVEVEQLGRIELENVCALWRGSDPELANEVIVVSAHYDHVGTNARGEIYNGADDNASGTAGLLGLAEGLVSYGPLERTVMLMWVSGEELGLLGSRAWALDPWLPEGMRTVANINLDMLGRNDPGWMEITPTSEHEAYNLLTRAAERAAPLEGFVELANADKDWNRSDHASFAKNLNVPVVYMSAGEHPDYHKPTDDADKIDADKIRRFMRLVLRILDDVEDEVIPPLREEVDDGE